MPPTTYKYTGGMLLKYQSRQILCDSSYIEIKEDTEVNKTSGYPGWGRGILDAKCLLQEMRRLEMCSTAQNPSYHQSKY